MADLLARARAGFDSLPVPVSARDTATDALGRWLASDGTRPARAQLVAMIDAGRSETLFDAFRADLAFGTGGQRGPVGPGPNRINPWTVARLARGHAAWLGDASADGVVVAYDARRFADRGQRWVRGVDNPVLGLTSRALAEVAAAAYAESGVRVWLQAAGDGRYLSTPELSFAVRHLRAAGGLMVTASHNPPDDNGVKVYDRDGAQIAAPVDDALAACISAASSLELPGSFGAAEPVAAEVREAWMAAVLATSRTPARGARIVFTALHGVGAEGAMAVLRRAGFEVWPVVTQCTPDGGFPTLDVGNPEVADVYATAIAHTDGHDLVIATDPDADRVGAAIPGRRGWHVLTGNEVAALVVDHVLTRWEGPRPLVVLTEPTSRWVSAIARGHGAEVIDHLPVGFKHIAGVLARLEGDGQLDRFAVGAEESHGVLTTAALRDKDAACGALALAEIASGGPVAARLAHLSRAYGRFHNVQRSTRLDGPGARERLGAAMARLVQDPPTDLAGRAVRSVADRRDGAGPLGPILSPSDRRARAMVAIEVDGGRVLVRPSGTEPKVKVYAEVHGDGDAGALAEGALACVSRR